MRLSFFHSFDIQDYEPLIEGLKDDFGDELKPAVEQWCNSKAHGFFKYWDMRLIGGGMDDTIVGICGLYYFSNSTKEAWLGWFGILPHFRGQKIGRRVIACMEMEASMEGAHSLWAYVGEDGPLEFYYKHGFKRLCSVKEYLKQNPDLDPNEFGEPNDHIIYKNLLI